MELSKLNEILKKSVNEMTDMEKWAVFFRYADVPTYRETLNKVIESKEVLLMAGDLLMSISKDEREQAINRSRRMYQSDLESNLLTAKAKGEAIGEARGEEKSQIKIARKCLEMQFPLEQIVAITGLTREAVEKVLTNT